MAPGKQKHYAVRQGRSVGVLSTWDECKESVLGCKGAQYKSFAVGQHLIVYSYSFILFSSYESGRPLP
ncbi:RNase H, partial [Haematococcus lacustris]